MVAKISPRLGWDAYTTRMTGRTEDARTDAMLDNMRLHHKYECLADPRIFDTMIAEPEYRFYGARGNVVLKGMDEVRAFYDSLWSAQSSLVELHVEHVAFAEWGAAANGRMRQQVPAAAMGGRATPSDTDWYLVETHLSWFFPYADDAGTVRLVGETCYIDAAGATVTPLDPADVLTMDEAVADFAGT